MKTILFHGACAVIGVLGAVAISRPALASPYEHAVDASGPNPIAIQYGDHTLNAGLGSAIDLDRFTFAGIAGDRLRITVASSTPGFDPLIELRGPPGGAVLQSSFCDGFSSSLCSTGFDLPLANSGSYVINISDVGLNETGTAYSLHLDKRSHYAGIGYGPPEIRQLVGHKTDVDFFAFDANAGTSARINVESQTGGLDPHLEVWNPAGASVSDVFCDGFSSSICSTSADITFSATGTYIVGISDVGANETGGYLLQVNCLFGTCPTSIPSPRYIVPEPETYLLMLAGLGFCVFVQQRGKLR
jgi:pre-peptidase/PEP-CTERM motif-containing protein